MPPLPDEPAFLYLHYIAIHYVIQDGLRHTILLSQVGDRLERHTWLEPRLWFGLWDSWPSELGERSQRLGRR